MATVKERNGSYLIRCSAGYNTEGVQIRKTMTWKPDPKMNDKQKENALKDVIDDFEEKVKGKRILKGNVRFADFTQRWLTEYAEKQLAPKTILHYKNLLTRINQSIGHMKLDDIEPPDLLEFYNKLGEDGVSARGGKLSPKTIREHHALISSILRTAVEWQYILSNVAERVKAPRVPRKELQYLDENEAKRVIELLADEDLKYCTAIILLIYSGMRRGELCGLRWSDIDFENNIVSIRRAAQYLPRIGVIVKEPKTATSIRPLKLATEAFVLLKAYKTWQAEQRLKLGSAWIDNDYIFTQWNGEIMHPDTLTSFFSDFAKKHNLPEGTVLHSLRHTNATLLIACGTPIRTVANRLGHANASTTINIYTHAIQSADAKAAEDLGDMLNPTKRLQKV